jgi:signal transduction histidine kinase
MPGLGVRTKLVLLGLLILVVVSFGFTALHLALAHRWVDEDLRDRAVAFAREVAATIADRREFESGVLLAAQIDQIMAVRPNVLQLDILSVEAAGTRVVATSVPGARLPFTADDARQVRAGKVVSRLVTDESGRYWEVMAPVRLDRAVVGAVAAKFSLARADHLAARSRRLALTLTAASVVIGGALLAVAVHLVVIKPVRRLMGAVDRVRSGDTAVSVEVDRADELGALAGQFNEMMRRIHQFNDELKARVKEATAEVEERYREVERLNGELFNLQRTLVHAERLAVPGRVMAQVAHEVGTPLHSVAGHLELLRNELRTGRTGPDAQRRLDVIHGQLERVRRIITELLDVTRRPPAAAVVVDLGALVRDTALLVRPGVLAGALRLDVEVEGPGSIVRGHPERLQQVVLNLLTNAIAATPPGGRIVLRVERTRGGVALEVSDTGPGIPRDQQAQVFEPFFSTKTAGRGSGLGLAISRQIVKEHGGRIELESTVGQGSVFRVVLPGGGD